MTEWRKLSKIKDLEKLELKLITYSSRAELPILAQAIQSDLKDIGINVSVEVSDNIMDILIVSLIFVYIKMYLYL